MYQELGKDEMMKDNTSQSQVFYNKVIIEDFWSPTFLFYW